MDDKAAVKIFAASGNEKQVEAVVSQLKFISKLQPGEKINVHSMNISSVRYTDRLYRTFVSGESRDDTLLFIHEVINRALELIYSYDSMHITLYLTMSALIVSNLQDSKKGLQNLMSTYEHDRMYVSQIEALLATLDAKIEAHENHK